MNKKLLAFVALILLAGCEDGIQPIVNRQTTVGQREFQIQEFDPAPPTYRTDETTYITFVPGSVIHNGTLNDIYNGVKIIYSASSFDWLHDAMGFSFLTYYVDEVTIVK